MISIGPFFAHQQGQFCAYRGPSFLYELFRADLEVVLIAACPDDFLMFSHQDKNGTLLLDGGMSF